MPKSVSFLGHHFGQTSDRLESPYNDRHLSITTCYNDGANDWKQNGHHQIELGALVDGHSKYTIHFSPLTHQSPVWTSAMGGSTAAQFRFGIATKAGTILTGARILKRTSTNAARRPRSRTLRFRVGVSSSQDLTASECAR